MRALCSRQHFPLGVYFVLSGTPGMMWAYETLGLLFAIQLAIPGVIIALGLQRYVERGLPSASPESVAQLTFGLQAGAAVRSVLESASAEAARRGHRYVGTEHLLLAMAGERTGVSADLLSAMKIESHQLLSALEFILGDEMKPTLDSPALTPRAISVMGLAGSLARESGRLSIEIDDLMAAILQEGQGVSAGILRGLGAEMPDLRQAR